MFKAQFVSNGFLQGQVGVSDYANRPIGNALHIKHTIGRWHLAEMPVIEKQFGVFINGMRNPQAGTDVQLPFNWLLRELVFRALYKIAGKEAGVKRIHRIPGTLGINIIEAESYIGNEFFIFNFILNVKRPANR